MRKFKVGDLVYYPTGSVKIFKLESCRIFDNYPICIYFDDGCDFETFNHDGFVNDELELPSIFHATPENHALLEKLYGVEFEKLPVKPTDKEIIQAMLDSGYKCVPCWVSDWTKYPKKDDDWRFITCIRTDAEYPFITEAGGKWRYATPFDPCTGKPITELPE